MAVPGRGGALRGRGGPAGPSVDDAGCSRLRGTDPASRLAHARDRGAVLEAGGGDLGVAAGARMRPAHRCRARLPPGRRRDWLRRRTDPCRHRHVHAAGRRGDREDRAPVLVIYATAPQSANPDRVARQRVATNALGRRGFRSPRRISARSAKHGTTLPGQGGQAGCSSSGYVRRLAGAPSWRPLATKSGDTPGGTWSCALD